MKCRCGQELLKFGNLWATNQEDIERYLRYLRGLVRLPDSRPKHNIRVKENQRIVADGECQD